jgi:hypothetical protein
MLMAFVAGNHSVEFVPVRTIAATRKSRIHPLADSLRWWKWWRAMKKLVAKRQRNRAGRGVSGPSPIIPARPERTPESSVAHSVR